MTRINTNVSSLTAQNRLNRTNSDLQTSLTRLSTGLRINSGKDDPAGLIASESLRSDITSINKALSNTQRANQIIGTADSALGQVSSLLNDIRGLVTEAANKGALSDDEIAANQLQVDSSLEAINRIAQTTTFQGRRLLDGSLDFQVAQGTGYSTVKDLQIDSANLGATGSVAVNIEVIAAATQALVTADIPAVGASAKAATTFTFNDNTVGAEASGKIDFANSKVITTEASGTVVYDGKLANAEASGVLALNSGAAFKITAKNNTIVDGATGNNVQFNITTTADAKAANAAATYNADSNTVSLVLKEGATGAEVVTALTADTKVNSLFTFASGNGTVAAGDAAIRSAVLSGGTDSTVDNTTTQASGSAVELGAGLLKFDITAGAGKITSGAIGNGTKISYTYAASAAAATYDQASNTLSLTINTGKNAADNVTDLNTALGGLFVLSNGSGTPTGTSTGSVSSALSGGLDPAQFKITAKDGGPADGLIGNSLTLNYTTSSNKLTTAAYDAANNKLNISVGQGATINDIANAVNATNAFTASDVKSGSARYTAVNGSAPVFSGGNTITSASAFTLKAVDGGLADGSFGNSTKIKFEAATDGATTAAYDEATNQLTVKVKADATIQNVADAITAGAGSVFQIEPGSIVNAGAIFNSSDYATLSNKLQGGTTNVSGSKDELIITATNSGVDSNGVKVTFEEDSSITAGAPTASIVGGNIVVKVSNTGDTKLRDIAEAITGISGGLYKASLSVTSNGDGVYKGSLEAPPASKTLLGGVVGGGIGADLTFQLTGGDGSEVFKFQKGATAASILQSVNLLKDSTGIEASLNNTTNKLELKSLKYGSEGIVSVEVLSEGAGGTFGASLEGGPRAVGSDIQATVNGTVASGKGNRVSLNTATLSFGLTVADGSSTNVNFTITGGGAQFQLGPDVVSNQQARLGITSLNTAKIGGVNGKLLELASSGNSSLVKNVTNASAIVDQVINKVTTLRGRLGAFQRTALESNVVSLNDSLSNLNEAQSSIRDADFAKESANLTRAQILVQSGTSVLGIANQSAQSVLSLLR
ncbi:MAG: flagellin [Pirellula sp.]